MYFGEVDQARHQRQQEFMEKAAEGHRVARSKRLGNLVARESAIADAIAHYASLDTGVVTEVALRSAFIGLEQSRDPLPEQDTATTRGNRLWRDWSTRPPLAKLARRSTQALALYLTAIYVAHLEAAPNTAIENTHSNVAGQVNNPTWAALAGLGRGPSLRARRLRVQRALRMLEGARLVDLKQQDGHTVYEGFQLLRDDGAETPYLVPGTRGSVLRVPSSFFYNGWHIVLRPAEVTVLFAAMDMERRVGRFPGGRQGVALPRRVRWERYGISDESYTSVHELAEFGLLRLLDVEPERHLGRLRRVQLSGPPHDASLAPEPYRLAVQVRGMGESAWDTATAALKRSAEPPRFASGFSRYAVPARASGDDGP